MTPDDAPVYHVPVLWQEVCDALITTPDGVYADGTLGGGGHAEKMLQRLNDNALYIGIDRDPDALKAAGERLKKYPNFRAVKAVFHRTAYILAVSGVEAVNGVLLDLGVSSWQIDSDHRGFTFRENAPLDMRMDPGEGESAEDLLNRLSERELADIFFKYGEERRSRCIARRIVRMRQTAPLTVSSDLLACIDPCTDPRYRTKSYARIFQALRIAVNDELNILEKALKEWTEVLKPGSRIAVITYHSLEDRIVKHFFRLMENPCTCPPHVPVCTCGKQPLLKRLRPYFRTAEESETADNARARSAKLRVAEKL